MASWTDTQPLTFAPYVGKVDPELYGKAITYKQQKYDQGVEQVQTALDKVGGLDILHPLAKQYYQQQFEGIKNQLGTLAKADFSNNSIVSQATSMANSLLKDEAVQNAIISTQSIRALQKSQMEKKQKGEYAPQAEWIDNSFVENYKKNNDISQPYNGPTTATNYNDYHPELNKILKDLDPDIDYNLDESGNIQLNTIKSTIVSPLKIKETIQGFFATNPKYQSSLDLDAMYTYRNHTPEQMEMVKKEYINNVTLEFKKINDNLFEQIKLHANNQDYINQLEKNIAENKNLLEQTTSRLNSVPAENLKQTIFNSNVINDAVNRYQKIVYEPVELPQGKSYLELLKVGLKKDGTPITPNDPEYGAYLTVQENLNKQKKDENSENTGYAFSNTPLTVSTEDGNVAYNETSNLKQQEDLYKQISDLDIKMQQQKGLNPDDWKKYKSIQENKLRTGDSPDPDYVKYKAIIRPTEQQLGAVTNVLKEAREQAAKEIPLESQSPFKVDIKIDGKLHKLNIDPKRDELFLSDLKQLSDELAPFKSEVSFVLGVGFLPETPDKFSKEKMQKIDNILNKYKSNPNYQLLKSIYSSGKINDVLTPLNNVLNLRSKKTEEILKQKGVAWEYKAFAFKGKPQEENEIKNIVKGSIREQTKGEGTIPLDDDVDILDAYPDINGKTVIRYTLKDKEGVQLINTGIDASDILPKQYDKHQWLKRTIESNGGKTSEPLYTNDGKIRYGIVKSALGGYIPQIITTSGTRINVVNTEPFSNPGDILETFERFSKDPNLSKLNREDLNYYLTHTQEEFNNYIKNKK